MCSVNPPRPVTLIPQVENLGHDWVNVNEVYKVQTWAAKIWIATESNLSDAC